MNFKNANLENVL